MEKQKQIEAMAKTIEITEQIARDAVGALPSPKMYATDLYEKGYRKQSETAREIINEFEQTKTEIVDRMEEFKSEWLRYSESTIDYHGGKAEAMEIALCIVKSILTDEIEELKRKFTEGNHDS